MVLNFYIILLLKHINSVMSVCLLDQQRWGLIAVKSNHILNDMFSDGQRITKL